MIFSSAFNSAMLSFRSFSLEQQNKTGQQPHENANRERRVSSADEARDTANTRFGNYGTFMSKCLDYV